MKPSDRGPVIVRPPGSTCPIPVGRDTNISQIAESCLETVAQDPYDGDDPRFQGKTNLEATILSLAKDAPHDPDARKEFLDRTMGKPKQRVDSTSLNITLSGFLDQLATEEDEIIDITPEENDEEFFS